MNLTGTQALLGAPQPLYEEVYAPLFENNPPRWLKPFSGPQAPQINEDERFSSWLDTRTGFRSAPADPLYAALPLTAELWAAVRPGIHQPQVLLAGNTKESRHYWEIGVNAGNNKVYASLPGRIPDRIWSHVSLDDLDWHHIALELAEDAAELVVDGVRQGRVATRSLESTDLNDEKGGLTVGCAATRWRATSDANIAEIRVSRGLQASSSPEAKMTAQPETVRLWHFDANGVGRSLTDAPDLEWVVRHPQELVSVAGVPLDAVDLAAFNAAPAPMAAEPTVVTLSGPATHPQASKAVTLLDGIWEMAEGGELKARLAGGSWDDALEVAVPGSVHMALEKAGLIPDPKVGMNDAIAREQSFKTWWFRRTFERPEGPAVKALLFDGVAISCTVWLNGVRLGDHNGMFGGPHFPIDQLQDQNELIVRLDPAPKAPGWLIPSDNNGWRQTVVFNNVWGWHYVNIPAMGIWRSVKLEHHETVSFEEPPFVATHDLDSGTVDLSVKLDSEQEGWKGTLLGTVNLDGSDAPGFSFSHPVTAHASNEHVRLRFSIPDAQIWWPNGYGDQPLYNLTLTFVPDGDGTPSVRKTRFGLRTVQMAPAPGGPHSSHSNWTFVINDRPMFMRGSGWCTMDSSMDFSRERYDRFLRAAKQQNNLMVRAWGSGMPETDDFYELCDRYGLLVIQEWPTAWDSHEVQPQKELEMTVRLNTLRLRNHPSLVMWGGGNESWAVFTPMIDRMGRISQELDGTRAFHRTQAYGGSTHNYGCWWDRKHLDHNLQLTGLFLGEFGITSLPVHESVLRYLPDEEKEQWPPKEESAFAHHTPVFNSEWGRDLERLKQYSGYLSEGANMEDFIRGSQVAQAVALRHTLELARARWPESTGALYYKLNDNHPAASWATWDWYGAPKIAHWFVRSAFEPLHAAVILPQLDLREDTELAVHLLDDTDALDSQDWAVKVRAFGQDLREIAAAEWQGSGSGKPTRQLGALALKKADLQSDAPLFFVAEVSVDGTLVDRSWSFANFERKPDSLFNLPTTTLDVAFAEDAVTITNTGDHPAIGVEVLRPGHADTFTPGDGMLWIEPGQSRQVAVSETDGVIVSAWNAKR